MRWVAWVVVASACGRPGGGTLAPAASETPDAPSSTPPPADAPSGAVPVDALPALPSASGEAVIGSPAREPKSKLCEVVVDGLTVLRRCTGAAGEKTQSTALGSKSGGCLVKVGDLDVIRPCEGKPNERKATPSQAAAPSSKMCERVEHTADGDIVVLRPCSK